VKSPVDKSSGGGMQDTLTIKPVTSWFGAPPRSILIIVDKGVSRLHVDRDACKGSTDTPRGATFGIGTTPKLKNGSSAKRSQTVRDDGVKGSKSRTSVALARRACQSTLIVYIIIIYIIESIN
jgi:hypothetical protein